MIPQQCKRCGGWYDWGNPSQAIHHRYARCNKKEEKVSVKDDERKVREIVEEVDRKVSLLLGSISKTWPVKYREGVDWEVSLVTGALTKLKALPGVASVSDLEDERIRKAVEALETAKTLITQVEITSRSNELREAIRWFARFTPKPAWYKKAAMKDFYEKGDEHYPFFTERFLYGLFGKDEARSILGQMRGICEQVGLDLDTEVNKVCEEDEDIQKIEKEN